METDDSARSPLSLVFQVLVGGGDSAHPGRIPANGGVDEPLFPESVVEVGDLQGRLTSTCPIPLLAMTEMHENEVLYEFVLKRSFFPSFWTSVDIQRSSSEVGEEEARGRLTLRILAFGCSEACLLEQFE